MAVSAEHASKPDVADGDVDRFSRWAPARRGPPVARRAREALKPFRPPSRVPTVITVSDAARQSSTPDPAETLGVPTTTSSPAQLAVHTADHALSAVHSLDSVAPDAALDSHPDPAVPGAHYVESLDDPSHPRYWVGMAGEVLATSTDDPRPGANPEVRRARAPYLAAVEAVRLRHRLPMDVVLFSTPDAFVPGAHFVHESVQEPSVWWVDAAGGVHDGYRVVDGDRRWDPTTVAARRDALLAQPSTAALVDAVD